MDLFSPDARPDGLEDRAARWGCETLADHEALTLILQRSCASGAPTYARALLARFGSFAAVLAAPIADLTREAGAAAALDLTMVNDATRRIAAERVARRCVISSWSAVLAYVKVTMQHRGREAFRVLFLDKKNQLIADEVMNEGSVDHAPVYPREVMRRALELNASAVILLHNHPSGDPTPSRADIAMTGKVVEAGRTLCIGVHDHLIVGAEGVASLKSLGLM